MSQAATAPAPRPASRSVNRTTLYFFGALGGILFGYDLGVIAGILVLITKLWHLSALQKGVITASLSVGAMIGAAIAGRVGHRLGRRRAIMIASVVVIIGTIAAASSPNWEVMMIGRGVIGIGIGCSSASVPAYLSELAPTRQRGALSSLNQVFIVSGILIAFLTDYALAGHNNWRAMFLGALIPAVILFAGLWFLPESPRWLVNAGREDDARAVLVRTHQGEDADAEIEKIREVIRLDSELKGRWRDLGKPWVRPMLIVALILAIGQQFSGVNAINAYFPTMLTSLGFATRTALLSAVILGVAKLAFTLWELAVVDRWGRKPLLVAGAIIMTLALIAAGISIQNVHDKNTLGATTLVFLILYLAGYELGWGAVVWVMIAEIFPLRARAAGTGFATVVLWAATGIVTAVFPTMSDPHKLGIAGSMYVFASVSFVLILLAKFVIPETKARSLEQIELDLRHSGLGRGSTGTGSEAEPVGIDR